MKVKFDDFLLERLGISQDAIELGDFIYEYIKDSKFDKKTIEIDASDLNISFKVKSIEIRLYDEETSNIAGFSVSSSKNTEDGFVLCFSLNMKYFNIEMKSSIYHEAAHAIQFMHNPKAMYKMNKHQSSFNYVNNYINKNLDNYTKLLFELIYLSDSYEINSFITESYNEIRDIVYKYNLFFTNEEFRILMLFTRGWYLQRAMDISDEDINKIPKKELKTIFSFAEEEVFSKFKYDKDDKFYMDFENDSFWTLLKKSYEKYKLSKVIRKNELDLITDEELENKVKYYKNKINKKSKVFKNKLYKIYDILNNEFKSKEYINKNNNYWNKIAKELNIDKNITELQKIYNAQFQKAISEMNKNLKK